MTPRIAIMIPIFRHSTLANEAISCALSLSGGPEQVVIAVDDGCPNAETRAVLDGWSLLEPERFHRIHQANRGLSGARNSGIQLALELYPDLDAIYLLDADNRLDDHALALFGQLLRDHPEADWFYPNFDMFGLNSAAHNGSEFSLAQLAESNICEAGSLIRRRVLDAGIRFDETMRSGYEDWEFWLSAANAGFRGMPVRQSFFRYRKRPESMLSGSHGKDDALRAEIRRRHGWLYDGDTISRLAGQDRPWFVICETGEAPRYAHAYDPDAPTPVSEEQVVTQMTAAALRPAQVQRPLAYVFVRPGVLEHLAQCRLSASVFWHLHTNAQDSDFAFARIVTDPRGQRGITASAYPEPPARKKGQRKPSKREVARAWDVYEDRMAELRRAVEEEADILLIRSEVMDKVTEPLPDVKTARGRLDRHLATGRINEIIVATEGDDARSGQAPLDALRALKTRILDAREIQVSMDLSPWRAAPAVSGPGNHEWILSNQTLGGLPLPIARRDGAMHIGFVAPIFQFGGVEKCVVALAAALKRQGVHCHLFVYGDAAMTGTGWLTEPFESIHHICDPVLRSWDGPQYMGTNMASEPEEQFLNNMIAALTGMDAVIITGSAATYYGLTALRAKGILTLSWEHLFETDDYGRVYGTPYLAVAYEGALDMILTCSRRLADWLHGQGVPREKLLALPNGTGFPMSNDEIADALAARRGRKPGDPLRVGFLGRLDAQKGADRFLSVAAKCRELPIEFSITGSAVLGADGLHVPDWITRYPAAFGIEELKEAFARLDVLLMPSRDEGLPLTIMEAQRVGVIPVATDVGAVSEGIVDGETGFLLENTDVEGQMAALLARLAQEPRLRARISSNAAGPAGKWDQNAALLLRAITPMIRREAFKAAG
ncbi:glycosyltransferase [Oceanibium sediminis]|uniref:glycosyltransferase n=1 Tax=Oceanibium sediminis TaxID=2026339 RepID=UPI000DD3C808|nr:glycosyltransferase [Oceanibium sediminis]